MSGTALAQIASRFEATVLPDDNAYRFKLRIKSSSTNAYYVVSQRKSDGLFVCGCLGGVRWRTQKGEQACKHLQAMVPIIRAALDCGPVSKPSKQLPAPKPKASAPAPRRLTRG